MALRKTAIALPEDLLQQVDEAAFARGESRNRFIIAVLRRATRARRDAALTRQLDQLFADEELAEQQVDEAAALDAVGTDWTDERW